MSFVVVENSQTVYISQGVKKSGSRLSVNSSTPCLFSKFDNYG